MATPLQVDCWIKTPAGTYPGFSYLLNLKYVAKIKLHDSVNTRVCICYPTAIAITAGSTGLQTDKIDFADNASALAFIAAVEGALAKTIVLVDLS